jgi:hypothetical protein
MCRCWFRLGPTVPIGVVRFSTPFPRLKDSVGELLRGPISRKTLLESGGRGMRAPTRDSKPSGFKNPQTQSQPWIGRGAYPAPAIYAIVSQHPN